MSTGGSLLDLGFSFFDLFSSSEFSSGGLTILSLITVTTLDFYRLRTGTFFFFFASFNFSYIWSFSSSFWGGSGTLGLPGIIS